MPPFQLFSASSVLWVIDRAKLYVDKMLVSFNAYCKTLSVHIGGIGILKDNLACRTAFQSESPKSEMLEHENERFWLVYKYKFCTESFLFLLRVYLWVGVKVDLGGSKEMLELF